MSRFTTNAISLALVVATLSLSVLSLTGGQVYAAHSNRTSLAEPAFPGDINLNETSPYDATYYAKFSYEYRKRILNPIYPKPGQEKYLFGDKHQASFTFIVTFATLPNPDPDYFYLLVKNVIVTDEVFGTGKNGIAPEFGATIVFLPRNIASPRIDRGGLIGTIQIHFPTDFWINLPVTKVTGLAFEIDGNNWDVIGNETSDHPLSGKEFPDGTQVYEVVKDKQWRLDLMPKFDRDSFLNLSLYWAAGAKIISGQCEIFNELTNTWGEYDGTDLPVQTGAWLRMKSDYGGTAILAMRSTSSVIGTDYLEIPPGGYIRLWPRPENPTPQDTGKRGLELYLGKIKILIEKLSGQVGEQFEVFTPEAIIRALGTEFTVEVDNDGTTTTRVLNSSVEVQDITSGNTITVKQGESITIPKTTVGLTKQEMPDRVTKFSTATMDKWWQKEAAGGQPAVRKDGSFAVGKFEILSGSRLTPEGFLFAFTAIAAIFFLVVGRVYAFRLKRMQGRSHR